LSCKEVEQADPRRFWRKCGDRTETGPGEKKQLCQCSWTIKWRSHPPQTEVDLENDRCKRAWVRKTKDERRKPESEKQENPLGEGRGGEKKENLEIKILRFEAQDHCSFFLSTNIKKLGSSLSRRRKDWDSPREGKESRVELLKARPSEKT